MSEWETGVKTFSKIFSLSFSGKKIAIQIVGILCAALASLVILGIGGAILSNWLQPIVGIVNWIAVLAIVILTWGAISKVTIAEVADLPPVDIKNAIRIALNCARHLILAPLKIAAIILVLMIIHVIAGWIGLIPVLGEIIWSFLAIPLFFLSGLIVISQIILFCGMLLLPPIIMVGKESPVSELNDFLRENTLRFIGYLLATIVVVGIVSTFLNMIVSENESLSSWAMGDKYSSIVASVPPKLNAAIERVTLSMKRFHARACPFMSIPPAGMSAPLVPVSGLRWTYGFAGFIWGIFTLLIYLALLSLPMVILGVSGTLIYLGLKPEALPKQPEPAAEQK